MLVDLNNSTTKLNSAFNNLDEGEKVHAVFWYNKVIDSKRRVMFVHCNFIINAENKKPAHDDSLETGTDDAYITVQLM